mmetsp:Transcript_23178/g.68294  ORF Transcript_23178/g.68294 Transcript_23178/m.68294 type:complete len:299 (+) Transcript_23178:306-1202(+)
MARSLAQRPCCGALAACAAQRRSEAELVTRRRGRDGSSARAGPHTPLPLPRLLLLQPLRCRGGARAGCPADRIRGRGTARSHMARERASSAGGKIRTHVQLAQLVGHGVRWDVLRTGARCARSARCARCARICGRLRVRRPSALPLPLALLQQPLPSGSRAPRVRRALRLCLRLVGVAKERMGERIEGVDALARFIGEHPHHEISEAEIVDRGVAGLVLPAAVGAARLHPQDVGERALAGLPRRVPQLVAQPVLALLEVAAALAPGSDHGRGRRAEELHDAGHLIRLVGPGKEGLPRV